MEVGQETWEANSNQWQGYRLVAILYEGYPTKAYSLCARVREGQTRYDYSGRWHRTSQFRLQK